MRLKMLLAGALVVTAAAPAMAQAGAGRAIDMLAAMDANRDGEITRAEAQTARGVVFARLDADGDNALSEAERQAMRQGRGAGRGMASADADGDGRVTRAEFMAQPFRGFDRADADGNGIVSTEEIAVLRARFGGT